jgi:RecA-family ATPase
MNYNGRIRRSQSHARFRDWDDAARAGCSPKEAADAGWAGKEKVGAKPAPGIVWRCASDIPIEPITWLWPRRIAKGKHTCIAGDPGTGKSQAVIAVAATISRGGVWPCDEGQSPTGNVIILSAEDAASDTIVPRLLAAGADLKRVRIIEAIREWNGTERTFNLKSDIAALEKMILDWGNVSLVAIDTVNSYLGKTDSHKNAEVRAVLDPLSKMAERMHVAVLSVNHLSKGNANSSTKALHRFLGSIGFVGSPRVAFATFEDTNDPTRYLFLHAKNNLAPPPEGLAYRLEQTIVGESDKGIVASRIKWEPDHVSITANEALAADLASGTERQASREEAEDFLKTLLGNRSKPTKDVKSEAEAAGLSWATIRRAKDRLGIKAKREGYGTDGQWVWVSPP